MLPLFRLLPSRMQRLLAQLGEQLELVLGRLGVRRIITRN